MLVVLPLVHSVRKFGFGRLQIQFTGTMTKYSVAIIFAILILVAAPVASAQRLSTSSAGTGSDDPVLVGAPDVASSDDRAGARLAPGNHEYNSAWRLRI